MIRYTQKNVHSLFNGEDDVDEDGKRKKKRERKCLDFLCILYKFYFMREIESFLIVVLVINQKPLFRFVMTFSLSFCAITWTNVRKSNEWDPICVKFQASHSPI